MSLKRLILKCKSGDIISQSEIYHLFAGKLFAICLKYSKTQEEAEDNLQEAFITIFKKIDQFQFKGSFEGWMKRIVINTALQTYRQKNVLNLVEENYPEEVEVEIDENEISLDFLLKIIQDFGYLSGRLFRFFPKCFNQFFNLRSFLRYFRVVIFRHRFQIKLKFVCGLIISFQVVVVKQRQIPVNIRLLIITYFFSFY